MAVELHQFRYSHYNEKARWALDFKRVPHRRRDYLPGPHVPAVKRLSGQQQTPVLVWDGEVITGSAAILHALEVRVPEPRLYPEDVESCRRVEEVCRHFDVTVGPAVRTALFSVLIDHPGYLCRLFAGSRALPVRLAYRATLPLARGMIARGNGVADPDNVKCSFTVVEQALDQVAEHSSESGQLVGAAFTAADLTAAALLAPLARPRHPDMARPEPMPAAVATFLERWQDHPGVRWMLRQYQRHRSVERLPDASGLEVAG